MNAPQPTSASASPARTSAEPPSYLLVLGAGIATTAMTLFGVYWLDVNVTDFHVMGWYANYVIPAGAILVGIVAASGYGIVSWVSGIKITRALLAGVLLLQFGAYFGSQYVEFKSMKLYYKATGTPVVFFEYFDLNARSFAWKEENGATGSPLGVWGYFFRGLEILGFAAGGLVVPLALCKKPYCHDCRRYMRTRQLAVMPASVAAKKIKKSDKEGNVAYQAKQAAAVESAQQLLGMLRQMAAEGRTADFQKATGPLNTRQSKKITMKLPVRYTLHMVSCRQCAAGWLKVIQLAGHGKGTKATELARTEVPQDFVVGIRPNT